jgi:N-acylglucosamine-6-phosphate 2-epimerase
MSHENLLMALRHQLIVSVQADPGSPLDDPAILAALAQTVVQGGAAAIRASRPENIRAIRQAVSVPILGIYKYDYPDSPVYITPTIQEARLIVEAGCDILAVDATGQRRPNDEPLAAYFKSLRAAFSLPIMADISTLDEGLYAADLGADLVATTLAGYTPYSRHPDGPDFQLVEDLTTRLSVPVIVEGRIRTPQDVRRAFDLGAYAVVVGSMITRPAHITAYFATGLRG